MNIGFDAKRALYNRTGLGNYSRNLITALLQYYPEHHYQLFTPKLKAQHLMQSQAPSEAFQYITPSGGLWPGALWRSFGIPFCFSKQQTQIFHGLSAELPYTPRNKPIKYVVTIHDLIFLRLPHLYSAIDRKIYLHKTQYACKRADIIIAISEQTKRDLIEFLHIEPARIKVVYQNCNPAFAQIAAIDRLEAVRKQYDLPERFLLNVGTIEARKNARVILEALLKVPEDIKLVIVGKATAYQQELEQYIRQHPALSSRVQILNNVGYQDLIAIYQLAHIFIYPSIFEGFGIPVIEALSAGLPVIAATGSCLEEAGGPSSLYFAPDDADTLAAHIHHLWHNDQACKDSITAAQEHIKTFSAEQFAQNTMAVYQSLV